MSQQENSALSVPLWLVWATALGFVLIGLGSVAILDNNEGLYAEISREMLASRNWHDWIIPHLNGLPYMEKPPLLYWLTALSFALFGESEWSARLVPALSSLACTWMLMRFGIALKRPQIGRLAALMFASGVGVTAMSHVLMFDMLLTATLTAALMFAYFYLSDGSVHYLRYAYGFLALALLAKGFVALILFGLVVVTSLLITQHSITSLWYACGKWFEPWALVIFFAIAAPWHVAASMVEPIFAWFYFINEHVLRFLGRREPHDYYAGAWWYYLPRMAIYLFPWSFMVPCLFTRSAYAEDRDSYRLQQFLWLAWLLPLIFFSTSSAKANYYLVVVMPFAAFHLALGIEKRRHLGGTMRAIPGCLVGILSLLLWVVLALRDADAHQTLVVLGMSQHQFSLGVAAGLTVLAFGSAVVAWRSAQIGWLAYLTLPIWTFAALITVLAAMEPQISTRQLAHYLQSESSGRSVYLYRNFEEQSSLPFYLKKPVPIIDARSNDLFWGNKLRANDIMISAERFGQDMENKSVAVVVMDRQLDDFKSTQFFKRFKGDKRIGDTMVFFNLDSSVDRSLMLGTQHEN